MSIGLPSIAYANSADAPYIPSSKERGFTALVNNCSILIMAKAVFHTKNNRPALFQAGRYSVKSPGSLLYVHFPECTDDAVLPCRP